MGALTWNDFNVVNQSIGDEHSYLEFYLDIQNTSEERNGITLWVDHAVAFIDRDKSWVDSAWRTPDELRYNQVLFSIVELHRRYMQIELDTGHCPSTDYYMKRLVHTADSFCISTSYGRDTDAVTLWDDAIRQQLSEAAVILAESHGKRFTSNQFVTTHRFGMGMGGGMKAVMGDMRHYTRTGGGLLMDVECGQGRHLLNFGMYIGGSRCLDNVFHKSNPDQNLWTGDTLSALDLNITYGFIALENNKFRLAPYAGIGMLGYYYTPKYEDASSVGPTSFSYLFGVDLRYHLSNDMLIMPSAAEQWSFSLYAKAYLTYGTFSSVIGNPSCLTFNLAIGLAFHECGAKKVSKK